MEKMKVAKRIGELRANKKVSARDMSLSLGQSENYINHIENGKALPSMTGFFGICDYFNITPGEFFAYDKKNPDIISNLNEVCKDLTKEQLELLVSLAENLRKVNS